MNIAPTAGIAEAWSAAKPSVNDQAVQSANIRPAKPEQAAEEVAERKKSPPAPEGQGMRVDVRV